MPGYRNFKKIEKVICLLVFLLFYFDVLAYSELAIKTKQKTILIVANHMKK